MVAREVDCLRSIPKGIWGATNKSAVSAVLPMALGDCTSSRLDHGFWSPPGKAALPGEWTTPSENLNKLTHRIPKVLKAVIAANGGFFDEIKVWRRRQLLFKLKIIIYNLVNALTIIPIYFATHFMYVFMENKDISK